MRNMLGRRFPADLKIGLQKENFEKSGLDFVVFSARQHAERAICYRPSVRPSVTRVDQSKTVKVRIMQFSPYSSPIPLVSTVGPYKFRPEILMGSPRAGASN